jgi:hypothetical protein
MMDDTQLSADAIREQLRHTYDLFADIRRKFDGPGIERGGHERAGFTPVYLKKFGAYAETILHNVKQYTVEASFSDEQLTYVNGAIVVFRASMLGKEVGASLSERVVEHYLRTSHTYFLLAMLRATEDILRDMVSTHPQLVAALDALFRVAGGEGIRDLIRLYCAHLLEHTLNNAETPAPDLLAFVNVHDRVRRDETGASVNVKYEVWCPGNDFSRAYFSQCASAARTLVQGHGVRSAYPLYEEVRVLPPEISMYMTDFVQQLAKPVLQHYGIISR